MPSISKASRSEPCQWKARAWVREHVTVRDAPQLTPNDAGDDASRGFNSNPED